MKKLFFAIVISFMAVVVASCGSGATTPSSTHYIADNGDFVIESNGTHHVSSDTLPLAVGYNGKTIAITDVSFYQNVTNFSHNLFTVFYIDVSNLDDAEIHWLRESDLSTIVLVSNEANKYDYEHAPNLGSLLLTDSKELVFVSMTSTHDENRYSFDNSEVSVSLNVTQEETYEYVYQGETKTANKQEEISYTASTGESLPDPDTIENPLHDYIVKWLSDWAKAYS